MLMYRVGQHSAGTVHSDLLLVGNPRQIICERRQTFSCLCFPSTIGGMIVAMKGSPSPQCDLEQAGGAHFLAEKVPEGPEAPTGAPQEHPLPEGPSPPAEAEVLVGVVYDVRGNGSIAMKWDIDARSALPIAVSAPLFQ